MYHQIYGRKWKRRRGVLGKWREIKLALYAEYLRDFASGVTAWADDGEPIPD